MLMLKELVLSTFYRKIYQAKYLKMPLIGEGFILLKRGYRFMGRVYPPFDRLKICTSTYDIYEVKTLQVIHSLYPATLAGE